MQSGALSVSVDVGSSVKHTVTAAQGRLQPGVSSARRPGLLGKGKSSSLPRIVSVLCVLPLQDNKKMKKCLEEEQRARKDLEKLVRKVLKNLNDPAWDETNL